MRFSIGLILLQRTKSVPPQFQVIDSSDPFMMSIQYAYLGINPPVWARYRTKFGHMELSLALEHRPSSFRKLERIDAYWLNDTINYCNLK